jgi:DNA-binding CsgD family transcriptional regulator
MGAKCRDYRQAAWIRWFDRCGMPADHIGIVLGIDPSQVTAWLGRVPYHITPAEARRIREMQADGLGAVAIARALGCDRRTVYRVLKRGEAPAMKVGFPLRRMPPPVIRGRGATKARRLHALGYPAPRIATLLNLNPRDVRAFIPESRPEVSRPEIDRAEAWRYHDDVKPPEPPAATTEVPGVEPVNEPVNVKPPEPPAATPWTGPTDWRPRGEQHSSAKLTAADAREIRRLRSEGMSMYALAKRYGVAENTIRGIVTGKTWTDI